MIEMKAERVQEQSRKLQQMDELVGSKSFKTVTPRALKGLTEDVWFSSVQVEKNLSLEDQIVHVLQQNEDLKVRIDNCQTLIQ